MCIRDRHVYVDGIYKQGEDFLHGQMIKLIPTISDARRKEVYKYIKASLDTPTRTVAPPELIPFKSRIYDLKSDRFIDYSPEYVFLNRFPYDYRPDAPDCPLILDTIKQIAAGDGEVFNLICEAFGNCFYPVSYTHLDVYKRQCVCSDGFVGTVCCHTGHSGIHRGGRLPFSVHWLASL